MASKWYFSDTCFAESTANWLPSQLNRLGLADILEKGPFVDLGCGLGTVLEELQKEYPNLPMIGVDCDAVCLEKAKSRVSENTVLIKAFLQYLPFDNDSIPIMFSHKIYQLCNEKTYPEIACEIHRTLQPGGIYIASEDMRNYKDAFLNLGLVLIDEDNNIFRKPN